jgi:ubiquinone/menaquinone biosynthesis C-methylase UbiE
VRELAQAGAHVTGCDFSFAATQIAAVKLRAAGQPCAGVVQGDAQKLPFASSSFDMVISCETIEHLPNVQAGLREMHRLPVRAGGCY